ncbi:MAG: carbohydrate kinase family protein [Chloroflexi bacterium]|nr:carbohydrate kinase family protein [Chloroflexota bacterium]
MSIMVTGSIAYDYLMSFPGYFKDHILPSKIETLSVSFLVDSMRRLRGGCATNIAYNLALLGQRPRVMATVGEDFADYRAWLEEQGVDTSRIVTIPNDFTASFFVSTDRANCQIASFYTGAMKEARTLSFRDGDPREIEITIISPNDPEAMTKYVQECHELGIPYIYDPSQQIIRLDGEVLRAGIAGSKAFIVNEYELEMTKNKTGLTESEITALTETLVVTLAERGSVIYHAGREIRIPVAKPVEVVDPTGVGDAYRAGFIVSLLRGYSWETTGRMGALAATYVLEQAGTQAHRYDLPEFVARYQDNFGDSPEIEDLLNLV